VARYLNGYTLKEAEVYLTRAYLWQWAKARSGPPRGVLKALRLRVAAIADTADVRKAIGAMADSWRGPAMNRDAAYRAG
jgi:hypothetical protein